MHRRLARIGHTWLSQLPGEYCTGCERHVARASERAIAGAAWAAKFERAALWAPGRIEGHQQLGESLFFITHSPIETLISNPLRLDSLSFLSSSNRSLQLCEDKMDWRCSQLRQSNLIALKNQLFSLPPARPPALSSPKEQPARAHRPAWRLSRRAI